MPAVSFSLKPDDIVRLHDAISVLSGYGIISWSSLVLTALDPSKTAYAALSLKEESFLQSYHCSADDESLIIHEEASFACQLHSKVLLSVFKGRGYDAKERESPIERCEVKIQDRPDEAECRLIVNMTCRQGVIKTYKLTYDPPEIMHALFDEPAAKNTWAIGAHVLKTFCEYFGAKRESLDLFYDGSRAVFTSYSDKKIREEENLSKPLQTSIALDTTDFETYMVEEDRHVAINVKFFKAIVTHADQLRTTVSARYSRAASPLQLSYGDRGLKCEFTLMTIGGGSTANAPNTGTSRASKKPTKQPPAERNSRAQDSVTMPPPSQPAARSFAQNHVSQRSARPSPPLPRASIDHESLFVSNDDQEKQWEEKNYEAEEDELGWDASADNDAFAVGLRRPLNRNETVENRKSNAVVRNTGEDDELRRIAPTQRISQIKGGLFDN